MGRWLNGSIGDDGTSGPDVFATAALWQPEAVIKHSSFTWDQSKFSKRYMGFLLRENCILVMKDTYTIETGTRKKKTLRFFFLECTARRRSWQLFTEQYMESFMEEVVF